MGKWRENNKERYKELSRKGQTKYREAHKKKIDNKTNKVIGVTTTRLY
tara:strand:- start:1519 stop:1662 length:144 start_codon:yes stop_codon:yes gene_type:complete